jgi:hypothetical protein
MVACLTALAPASAAASGDDGAVTDFKAPPGVAVSPSKVACGVYSGRAHEDAARAGGTIALEYAPVRPRELFVAVTESKWSYRTPTWLHWTITFTPGIGPSGPMQASGRAQAFGNQAVLADFGDPAALARLKSLLMQNTMMHVSLDDALHTGFDVALDRVGPKLDQVFVCAHQHASALPEHVPDPDRVRMGDWIGMQGIFGGRIGCTVSISGPGHAMIIMLAATGPGADTVGFSLRNDGWVFPGKAARTVTLRTPTVDLSAPADASGDELNGELPRSEGIALLEKLGTSRSMTVLVTPHAQSWSNPIAGSTEAASYLRACGDGPAPTVN